MLYILKFLIKFNYMVVFNYKKIVIIYLIVFYHKTIVTDLQCLRCSKITIAFVKSLVNQLTHLYVSIRDIQYLNM